MIIIFAFIKLFIFGEPASADSRAASRAELRRQRTLRHQRRSSERDAGRLDHKRSAVLRDQSESSSTSAGPLSATTILAKTYYNVHGHQPESLDWFNVLIAQTIAQLRADALAENAVLASLVDLLNGPSKPEWLDEIRITEVALGEDFPIFSNCRVIPIDESGASVQNGWDGRGHLQARMDVDLSDVITLGLETKLVLNYPQPLLAVLPVALSVSIVRFSGTVRDLPERDTSVIGATLYRHALARVGFVLLPETNNCIYKALLTMS